MPGTPIVELTDISQLKLTISVPERDVLKFKKGQQVSVSVDAHDKEMKGSIYSISVQADGLHNFKVQVLVSNAGAQKILAGMYGNVTLSNNESIKALAVPRKALIGSTKKFVVTCNKFHNLSSKDVKTIFAPTVCSCIIVQPAFGCFVPYAKF
jgi:multidrug efflux pump subunit AcrA (membrane-fusion protein)